MCTVLAQLSEFSWDHLLLAGMALLFIIEKSISIMKNRGIDLVKIANQIDVMYLRIETVSSQVESVSRNQDNAKTGLVDKLHVLFRNVEDLWSWHNARDDDGTFKWWVTTRMVSLMEELTIISKEAGVDMVEIKKDLHELRRKVNGK